MFSFQFVALRDVKMIYGAWISLLLCRVSAQIVKTPNYQHMFRLNAVRIDVAVFSVKHKIIHFAPFLVESIPISPFLIYWGQGNVAKNHFLSEKQL